MKEFEIYYTQRFSADMQNWFDIDTHSQFPYHLPFIKFADRKESGRPEKSSDTEFHQNCFAAACFYTFLIPQVVAKVTGHKKGMYVFSKCSSWPILSCGLGGIMSPGQILKEAGLLGDKKEIAAIIAEEKDYFTAEVRNFLAGGQSNLDSGAYSDLLSLAGDNIEAIAKEIGAQAEIYADAYSKGETIEGYYINDMPE